MGMVACRAATIRPSLIIRVLCICVLWYCGIVAGPHRHLRILGLGIGLVYDDMVQCKLRLVPRSSFRPSTVYSMTLID